MTGFYILKPDMMQDDESLRYYLEFVSNKKELELLAFYRIRDWVSLSKLLYEPKNSNLSLEELRKIRKKMLVTIKGYEKYYKGKEGVLSLINIEDPQVLQELYDFKKELRRVFVNGTRKCYIKFDDDISMHLNQRLTACDTSHITGQYKVVLPGTEITEEGYEMIFFNKIHFSDPTISSIESDYEAIDEMGIIKPKNMIRKFNK